MEMFNIAAHIVCGFAYLILLYAGIRLLSAPRRRNRKRRHQDTGLARALHESGVMNGGRK